MNPWEVMMKTAIGVLVLTIIGFALENFSAFMGLVALLVFGFLGLTLAYHVGSWVMP